MRESVRALRLENKELRQRVADIKRAEQIEKDTRHRLQEERQSLQKYDLGLGERSHDGKKLNWRKKDTGKASELLSKMEEEFDRQIKSTPEVSKLDLALEKFIEEEDPDQINFIRK